MAADPIWIVDLDGSPNEGWPDGADDDRKRGHQADEPERSGEITVAAASAAAAKAFAEEQNPGCVAVNARRLQGK